MLKMKVIFLEVYNIINIQFKIGTKNEKLYNITKIFYNQHSTVTDERIKDIFLEKNEPAYFTKNDDVFYCFNEYSENKSYDKFTLKQNETCQFLIVVYCKNEIEINNDYISIIPIRDINEIVDIPTSLKIVTVSLTIPQKNSTLNIGNVDWKTKINYSIEVKNDSDIEIPINISYNTDDNSM